MSSAASSSRYFGRETKFQKVRLELEQLANRLGPGQKLPSIRELSALTGASISTLSGALEELEKANLVYRQHGKGIFVQPTRPRSVWLICDANFFASGHSPFWDVLVEQARVRALMQNEQLSLHFTLPCGDSQTALHHALVREIQEGRVHGVVGVGLGRKTADWVLDQGVAYTAFAGWAPYGILTHDESIVRQGVQALAVRDCRRIGLWQSAWPLYDKNGVQVASWQDMTEVFERAVRECGLSTDAGLVRTNVEQTRLPARSSQAESAQQQGYRTALEVFHGDRSQWPDGIVITDDMMTHGVLAAMAHLGIRPTVDVQIATHANKGITVFLGDPRGLIRLEYDPAEVVRRLFDILEALMNHQIPSGVRPHSPDAQVCFIEPSTVFVD